MNFLSTVSTFRLPANPIKVKFSWAGRQGLFGPDRTCMRWCGKETEGCIKGGSRNCVCAKVQQQRETDRAEHVPRARTTITKMCNSVVFLYFQVLALSTRLAMCKDERPMSAAHSPQSCPAAAATPGAASLCHQLHQVCSARSVNSPNRLTAADGLAPGAF